MDDVFTSSWSDNAAVLAGLRFRGRDGPTVSPNVADLRPAWPPLALKNERLRLVSRALRVPPSRVVFGLSLLSGNARLEAEEARFMVVSVS